MSNLKTLQISMVNRHGKTLRGIATIPEGDGKFPCVLSLHGFGGNLYGYKGLGTRIARELGDAGIACVRFDFYGNGESDGEFEEMIFSGLYEDAEDMFAWAAQQSFADSEKLFLSGQSMGGYVAASCAPKLCPRGLMLLCPGASMWNGAAQRADAVVALGQDWFDLEGLKYNMAFNYDLAKHPSPYEEAKGYNGPVLIVRASDDKMVEDSVCQSYAQVYNNVKLLTTEGGGHNFASIPARKAVTDAITAFVKTNS